jgi:hypothetical protein
MGAEARALGHGGIRVVARAAGVREATVSLGADELDSGNAKTIERGPPMAAQGPAGGYPHPRLTRGQRGQSGAVRRL